MVEEGGYAGGGGGQREWHWFFVKRKSVFDGHFLSDFSVFGWPSQFVFDKWLEVARRTMAFGRFDSSKTFRIQNIQILIENQCLSSID